MSERESFYDARRRELRERPPAVPLRPGDLQAAAREALPADAFAYLTAGAGSGDTARVNRTAFDRWRIRPRVLRDVSERSLDTDLFGRSLPAPVALAPVGVQSLFHPEGELASARAAASLGVPFSQSTPASKPLEAVADAGDGAPQFFQLYWMPDRDVTFSLLDRAERAGYDAVLLTVDFQGPRWVPDTLRTDAPGDVPLANLDTDPVAAEKGAEHGSLLDRDASITWAELAALRDRTDLPVVVKGVTHPDDAALAVDHGADGVVVSNHGGRQVDGGVAAVDALPDVVDAVGGETTVLFDSGVRSGADAFTALALGADAVCVGRPFLYGLALAGERGVYEVLHNLLAELDSVVALAGYDDVADVGREALTGPLD